MIASFPRVSTPLSCPSVPSLLVEGDPQEGPGRLELCAELGSVAAAASQPLPGTCHRTCSSGTRYSEPLQKEERSWPIWQPSLRTTKTCRSFDLIIPLLGIASNSKEEKIPVLFIALLFIIRRLWKQMPCPKIDK